MQRQQNQEILFVCVENAGRSQMAQAFAERYGLKSSSAGTLPTSKVNPIVVEAMKEKGIDISSNKPKLLTPEMINRAEILFAKGRFHRIRKRGKIVFRRRYQTIQRISGRLSRKRRSDAKQIAALSNMRVKVRWTGKLAVAFIARIRAFYNSIYH